MKPNPSFGGFLDCLRAPLLEIRQALRRAARVCTPVSRITLITLCALVTSMSARAQKVFLKTTNPSASPGDFLSEYVDMAVGADGSSYYLFDHRGTGPAVKLDDKLFSFGRPIRSYIAKMAPSGEWLWAATFEGTANKLDIRSIAVGDSFMVVGGSYIKAATTETATWKGASGTSATIVPVDETSLPVNPITGGVEGMPQRVDQGLLLKLDLDGNYLSSHMMKNCTLSMPALGSTPTIVPSAVDLASSRAVSAITSVAIGAGGAISVAGYTTVAATSAATSLNYHTTLLGKSAEGRTAWIAAKILTINPGTLGHHRRAPFVSGFDSSLRIRWAYQFLGDEGFKTWTDAQSNSALQGRFDRIRMDAQGNTFFAGRITGGALANGRDAEAVDWAGGLNVGFSVMSQSLGSSAGYNWAGAEFRFMWELLNDGTSVSYQVFNSYVIGRLDRDGQLTGLNLDSAAGTNVGAESAITDFVLTDNGGYATGWARGSGLEANPHLNTAADLSGLTRLMPNAPTSRNRADETRQNPFILRFSTFESKKLTVQNWAFLRNENWADPVSGAGISVEVLPDNRVVVAVANKSGVGFAESSARNTAGLVTTSTNEVNLRAAPAPASPAEMTGQHSLLIFNPDLTLTRERILPENVAPLPAMLFDDRSETYRQGRGVREARLALSRRTGLLMWSGLMNSGTLTLGTGQAATRLSASSASRPYVTALNLNRTSPQGVVPFAEQITVAIKSGLPPAFRDASQAGRPVVTNLLAPATPSLVAIRGTPLTVRVPYQLLTDVERVAGTGLPVAGNPAPLLYEKLATVSATPRTLRSYVDAGQWPNYPRTRYTFKNFRVEDRVQAGEEPVFTLVLDQDTTINVDYDVEHALDVAALITQETSTEQLLSDEQQRLLGNPTYSTASSLDENLDVGTALHPAEAKTAWKWGRSWVPKDSTVQLDVGTGGGLVLPLGERFVSSRYIVRNTTESVRTPDPNQPDGVSTFTIPSFAMTEPQEVEFHWRKQIQIQLGTLAEVSARDSVFIVKSPSAAPGELATRSITRPFQGLDATAGASSWVDYGTEVAIAAASTPPGGLQLDGWLLGNGHFSTSQGALSDLSSAPAGLPLGTRTPQGDAPMPGATYSGSLWMSPASHSLWVPKLTKPTFVVWNYGGFLFREYAVIGRAVDAAKINGSGADSRGNSYSSANRPGPILNQAPVISIVGGAPPGTTPDNAAAWDPVRQRLFPLRPGRFLARFETKDPIPADGVPSRPLLLELTAGFPGDPLKDRIETKPDAFELTFKFPWLGSEWSGGYKGAHYRHIAGAPGVLLDGSATDGFAFQQLAYFESAGAADASTLGLNTSGARVENGRFTAGLAGKSVLLFSRSDYAENSDTTVDPSVLRNPASFPAMGNRDAEPLFVRVVESRVATQDAPAWESGAILEQFDGSNRFINIPATSFPFPSDGAFSFSISFRAEPGKGGVILGQQNDVAPYNPPGGWIPALYVGTNGILRALFFNRPNANNFAIATTGRVDDGLFHHVAVTFATNQLTLYLDGVQVGTRTHTQTAYGNGIYRYQLGTGYTAVWPAGNNGWYNFTGTLTEPTIVQRVLTQEEIIATAGLVRPGNAQIIGQPVTSALDRAGLGTGWILNNSPKLLINPGIYNRDQVQGPIIPVNRRLRGDKQSFEDELVVVWYENFGKSTSGKEPGIAWPYQPVKYESDEFALPFGVEKDYLSPTNVTARVLDPRLNILYTSSRLGSEGLRKNGLGAWVRQFEGDVTRPGDRVLDSSANRLVPTQTGSSAIDDLTVAGNQFLNTDTHGTTGTPSGFVVTPSMGLTVISGITLTSADACCVNRSPRDVRIEGSNNETILSFDSGQWDTLLDISLLPPWTAGLQKSTVFTFNNSSAYRHYRITFRQTQGADADSVAISELELLGSPAHQGIKVYHQANKEAQGYNPNEEHALLAPAILQHPSDANGVLVSNSIVPRNGNDQAVAVFALRDDYNYGLRQIARDANVPNLDPGTFSFTAAHWGSFTSDPYVLVQYLDPSVNEPRMAVYFIGHESDIYKFRYPVTATQPVKAPYPVDTLTSFGFNDSRQTDNLDDTGTPAAGDGTIDGTYFINGIANAIGAEQAVWWMDPVGNAWAISGPVQRKDPVGNLIANTFTTPHLYGGFFYNLRTDFWHPDDERVAGDPVSWLPGLVNSNGPILPATVTGPQGVPTLVRYDTVWPDNLPILKVGETLTYAGGEFKSDNPTRIVEGEVADTPGLPGVIGWAAGQILFDSANPAMRANNVTDFTARLMNPLVELGAPVVQTQVTAEDSSFQPSNADKIYVRGGRWKFTKLSASLQKRISYDPILQKLILQGYVSDRKLGDPGLTAAPDPVYVLEPNILTVAEAQELAGLFTSPKWSAAVNQIYNLSRDPNQLAPDSAALPANEAAADADVPYLAGLEDKHEPDDDTGYPGSIYFDAANRTHAAAFGPGLAVVPNDDLLRFSTTQFAEGYVTLVENAHPAKPSLSPVTLHVIKLQHDQRYRGAIKTILSQNVFDEKITVKHTGDFGGNIDDVEYEWWFTPAVAGDVGTPNAPTPLANWQRITGQTQNILRLQGDPTLLLGDMQFFCRYKHATSESAFGATPNTPFPWQWAGAGNSPQLQADGSSKYLPQLVMGWVKRVLDRVNPYEARFSDFAGNDAPATYSSLIQQAGPPPRGPVALNPDKNVIENVGLIELYQTILDRAVALSIGLDQPAANSPIWQALMLAGTRLNQLHTILGNEAYSDAQDPTIGLGDAKMAPVLFSFQNQQATLLHEELALLRGTDFSKGWPVENRLFWNFVKGDGEPAYVSNYGIKDVNSDGFIDEKDGKILHPQGHGDAWGHYLSASKSHYALLRHPQFNWQTFAELYNLLDIVIKTDFLDEITFARTASAKARAGLEIVKNTYRLRYEQEPDGQWQGYADTDETRAWGVAEWATRAYHGAYFDWAVGNSLLPFQSVGPNGLPLDTSADQLNRIDRVSVSELIDIGITCTRIQGTLDEANNGINPLGVSQDAIAFDLDPNFYVIGSGTQLQPPFEQVYQRARQAGVNAVNAFQYANEVENRLREIATSTEDARRLAQDQDLSYRNQLIELFGTPYDGLIGPGGLYPPGYEGPDLLLFQYINYNAIDDYLPEESQAFIDLFTQDLYGSYRTSLTDAQRTLFGSYGIPNSGFTLKDLIEGFTHLDVVPEDPSDPFLATFYGRFASGKDFTIRSTKPESNPDKFPQLDDSGEGKGLISFNIPVNAEAVHGFRAEPNWGKRRATGSIQAKLQELVQAQIALRSAVNEYEGIPILLGAKLHEQQAGFVTFGRNLEQETALTTLEQGLGAARVLKKAISEASNMSQTSIDGAADAIMAAVPDVVGIASDIFAPVTASLLAARVSANVLFDSTDFAVETTFNALEYALQLERSIYNLKEKAHEFEGEQRQFVHELIELLAEESTLRYAIADAMASVVQRQQELDALIAQGFRLVSERELANKRLAADAQQNRYSDALLRANRNDALQRYLGSLDIALRYAFLAAKNFDFESNFDPSHPASPTPLLAELVRTRTLGLWVDGQPQVGQGGLAEVLAKLRANYDGTGIQLGYNNPSLEVGRFSLRYEWARIKPEESSDVRWRQVLQARRVDDLWLVPEFQRYCRPFAPASAGPQPGLVIPLSTEITEGKNFFGHPLGGMDHSYDATHYAPKIRAVGVWFTGYDGAGLSLTPRVYLVPTGSDIMLVPDSPTLQRRVWNVIDQKIPVPFPLSSKDLRNPNWIVSADSLDGSLAEMQKYSRFRAFPDFLDSDEFPNETELTRDSRLVGRSVWNTKWVLIIPGATLHANPDVGLDRFIGNDAAPGVADIKLVFETYAHSGR